MIIPKVLCCRALVITGYFYHFIYKNRKACCIHTWTCSHIKKRISQLCISNYTIAQLALLVHSWYSNLWQHYCYYCLLASSCLYFSMENNLEKGKFSNTWKWALLRTTSEWFLDLLVLIPYIQCTEDCTIIPFIKEAVITVWWCNVCMCTNFYTNGSTSP